MSSVITRAGEAGWGSAEGESALTREDFLEEVAQLRWDGGNGEQLRVGGRREF